MKNNVYNVYIMVKKSGKRATSNKSNKRGKVSQTMKNKTQGKKKKTGTNITQKKTKKIVFEHEKHNVKTPKRRIKMKNGAYEIAGKYYKKLVGTRDEVWEHIAYKTSYNRDDCLYRDDLFLCSKTGKVKSKNKSEFMKIKKNNILKQKNLLKTKKQKK